MTSSQGNPGTFVPKTDSKNMALTWPRVSYTQSYKRRRMHARTHTHAHMQYGKYTQIQYSFSQNQSNQKNEIIHRRNQKPLEVLNLKLQHITLIQTFLDSPTCIARLQRGSEKQIKETGIIDRVTQPSSVWKAFKILVTIV